jgi:Protein of unknown function (DUF1579)
MRGNLVTTVTIVTSLAITVGFAGGAQQPDIGKPGAEHKVLEPLVGTFTAKIKFWMDPTKAPSDSEGTITRKWIMDGRFLHEDVEATFAGMPFKGMGITGYDAFKKKYVATWVDSMSTNITMMEGTYDAKAKTLNITFDDIDPSNGKKMKGREKLHIVDNDHHVQDMYKTVEGGKETKVMEIHYHRAKK